MAHQLLFTSTASGLALGSTGYCTVEKTRELSGAVEPILEKLSSYDYLYGQDDPLNPVGFSHVEVSAAGRIHNVLSRFSDYGFDYSGRSNYLAHHVMPSSIEMEGLAYGPAEILSQGVMKTQWEGESQFVPEITLPVSATTDQQECHESRAACGDTRKLAGWARFLAYRAMNTPGDPVYILLPDPKQSGWPADRSLELVREAITLLPPDRRWRVTFSTYYSDVLAEHTCLWRFVVEGSPGFTKARALQHFKIDLTGSMPDPPEIPWVQLAQTGKQPARESADSVSLPVQTVIPEVVSLEDEIDEGTKFPEDGGADPDPKNPTSVAICESMDDEDDVSSGIPIKVAPPDNSQQMGIAEDRRRTAAKRDERGAKTSPGVDVSRFGQPGPNGKRQRSVISVAIVSVLSLTMVMCFAVSWWWFVGSNPPADETPNPNVPLLDMPPQVGRQPADRNPPAQRSPIGENGATNKIIRQPSLKGGVLPPSSSESTPSPTKINDSTKVAFAKRTVVKEGVRLTQTNLNIPTSPILVFAEESRGNSSPGDGDIEVKGVVVYGALSDRRLPESGGKVRFKNSTAPGNTSPHTVELKDGALYVKVGDHNDWPSFLKALWATAFVFRFERRGDEAYMCSPPVQDPLKNPYRGQTIRLDNIRKDWFNKLEEHLDDVVKRDDVRAVFVPTRVKDKNGDHQFEFESTGARDQAAVVSYQMIGVLRNLEQVVADKKMKDIKLAWTKRDAKASPKFETKPAIDRVSARLSELELDSGEGDRSTIATLGLHKAMKRKNKEARKSKRKSWESDWSRMNSEVLKACQKKEFVKKHVKVGSLQSRVPSFMSSNQTVKDDYLKAIKCLAKAARNLKSNLDPRELSVANVRVEGNLFVEFYNKSSKKIHVRIPYAQYRD